ncbi:hypothetical protein E2562_015801 [Oryza meyeriana var. granulata]|uniref:Uncharacterized protein n=1 Tax=Oryza meyeriana var. granulata TaxID=110450 RepID=A0A6G1D4I0_9ORYZ|nr:hypothetical protein E2562_015801 [Oryza meyeriana var. granulata]
MCRIKWPLLQQSVESAYNLPSASELQSTSKGGSELQSPPELPREAPSSRVRHRASEPLRASEGGSELLSPPEPTSG